MKKLFLLNIILIAFYFTANTQTARIGFTAGTALANQRAKFDGETGKGKSIVGLTAGVFVDVRVGEHFSFQPAVNFVQKGTKDEETDGGNTTKIKLSTSNIEVPLNFFYNTRGEGGNFFIGAGPSIAFAISGKYKFDDGSGSPVSTKVNFGSSDDDNLKGLDVGANFITGYNFSNGLLLSAQYNLGLSNLFPGGSSDGTLKSSYVGVKLGFVLGGKGKN